MEPKKVKQITDVLRDINAGVFVEEISRDYNILVRAVRKTGKSGEITIKLKIKPASKNNADVVMIENDVIVKLPRPDRLATLAYTTPEGNTQLRNPSQPELTGLTIASDNSKSISIDDEDDAAINLD